MKQLSLLEGQPARPTVMSKATKYTDLTAFGAAVFLTGQLATADGLAALFLRLYPGETEAAAAYLAAVDTLRKRHTGGAE